MGRALRIPAIFSLNGARLYAEPESSQNIWLFGLEIRVLEADHIRSKSH
jgi:hypothetical protein